MEKNVAYPAVTKSDCFLKLTIGKPHRTGVYRLVFVKIRWRFFPKRREEKKFAREEKKIRREEKFFLREEN